MSNLRTNDLIGRDEVPATPARPALAFPGSKIAAVLVWFGAIYTTYLAITALQPGTPWHLSLLVAAVIQFVFTMAERPILSGRAGKLTIAVFALDTIINAGGLYPQLANIGRTPTAQMLAAAGTSPDVGVFASIALALALGGIIAVAPESLWRMR